MIQSYKDLIVWQKSMDLVVEIYRITDIFPKTETFGLSIQMRRAAISIPSNIAEGKTRNTRKDYYRFLNFSYSSGAELETQLEISKRLGYLKSNDFSKAESLLTETMKMLNILINKLK